jgi:hypothetical protein
VNHPVQIIHSAALYMRHADERLAVHIKAGLRSQRMATND